jgi:hypothetical protein
VWFKICKCGVKNDLPSEFPGDMIIFDFEGTEKLTGHKEAGLIPDLNI